MRKIITLIAVCVLVAFTLTYFFLRHGTENNSSILAQTKSDLPNASWSAPQNVTEPTPLGNLKGIKMSGTLTSQEALLSHFENVKFLKSLGYAPDMNLSADGPGSSVWGYTRNKDGKTSIILFSYTTKPSSSKPDEPLQFNCPCTMNVSVFISNPFTAATQANNMPGHNLANPASTNCEKEGGTTVIKNGPNGQYGLCQFEDNMSCEEWALLRGQCPVGGVKTTGFDTIEQMYCAWVGGQTLAVTNATCTLPDGTVCSDDALYNGTCPTN